MRRGIIYTNWLLLNCKSPHFITKDFGIIPQAQKQRRRQENTIGQTEHITVCYSLFPSSAKTQTDPTHKYCTTRVRQQHIKTQQYLHFGQFVFPQNEQQQRNITNKQILIYQLCRPLYRFSIFGQFASLFSTLPIIS